MQRILIAYATLTGNTETMATQLHNEMSKQFPGCSFELLNIRDVGIDQLTNYSLVLLGASSWSNPINPDAEEFIVKLENEKPNLSPVSVALFGLGDSQFENFCAILPLLQAALAACKAKIDKQQFTIDGYPNEHHALDLVMWAKNALKNTLS